MNLLYFIPRFASGGAEAFIVNVCEQMVARGHSCSIVSIDSRDSVYDSRLERLGIKRTTLVADGFGGVLALYGHGLAKFKKFLDERNGLYDVVHFNIAQGEELPFIWVVKRSGIPVRILHSHNAGVNSAAKLAGHKVCKFLFRNVASSYLACSDKAAEWLIPKRAFSTGNYSIVKNGIATDRFAFDGERREATRRILGFDDEICLLIVGRLDRQKNHSFLLDVFSRLVKDEPRLRLVCVGDGPLKAELQQRANELRLSDNVIWLGVREDVADLYCAADCFVLPSLFEGFPFCLVEAQAAGLRCVVADTVSSQCALTDLVRYRSLDIEDFAAGITDAIFAKPCRRGDYVGLVRKAGYDIGETADALLVEYEGQER